MGFIDDKSNIEKEIGIFKVMNNLPKGEKVTSSIESVKNTGKNILPYLTNMLSVACQDPGDEPLPEFSPTFSGPPPVGVLSQAGPVKCNVIRILLEILIEFLPELIRIVKEAVAVAIREALSCSSDFKIPINTVQVMDLSLIDYNEILRTDPENNLLGGIFYGDPERDFNRFLYNLIQTPFVTESWEGENGPILDVMFITPGQISMAVNPNYENKSFNDFISDYIDSIEIFNQKMLLGNIMDNFFGNITSRLVGDNILTIEQVEDQQKTNKLIDKILDTDPCQDEIVFDDSFFEFKNEDLAEIEKKSRELASGIVAIDLGCGVFNFNAIGSPLGGTIGRELFNMDNTNDPVLKNKATEKLIEETQETMSNISPENSTSIKAKFAMDASISIPKVVAKMSILTPKILGIYNLSNFIVNGTTVTERNSYDWSKSNRVFIEYIARESLAVLVKIIFNKLKVELLRLIAFVVQKILKSIVDKKLAIIASFLVGPISGAINGLVNKIPTPEIEGSKYK